VKYSEERNKKNLELLELSKAVLPPFCNRFFLGIAQTTSPLTRLNYAYDLNIFFSFLISETDFNKKVASEIEISDLNSITVFHVELFADFLSKSNKSHGKMRKLACLRSFFAYFFKNNEINANIMPNVDLPKIHEKPILRLEGTEIQEIVTAAAGGAKLTMGQKKFHGKTGLRDATILAFFLTTGVRVSELVGLNCGDIDLERGTFIITRKGGSQSLLYMSQELREILNDFLYGFEASSADSPLFTSIQGERLGVRAVQNLVKKYAAQVSPLKNISPHKLRSTYGTSLYKATGDIYVVADVLGHRNVNTTKKHYAAMDEATRQAASQKVKIFN